MNTILLSSISLAILLTSIPPSSPAQWVQTNGPYGGSSVNSFVVLGNNLFAGTKYGEIFCSTDAGRSWIPAYANLSNAGGASLLVFGSSLFAGYQRGGVLISNDSGKSWTALNNGLTSTDVEALAGSGTNIFVGTGSGGVFRSTDSGISWIAVNAGLTNTAVSNLAVSGTDLFAGTDGSAVWRRRVSELASVDSPTQTIPKEFELLQNYPNPFNPFTMIRYALPGRSHVSLSVFNTLGQQVATLVNQSHESGYHDVRFDASRLASGVYFYRLQAGSFVQTKKLLILR